MNHKLFTTLSGLSISAALLIVGLLPGGQAAGLSDDSRDGVVETIEADAAEAAGDVAPAPPKHRRGRASLSIPYFSFAQSLRPRG